MEISCFRRVRAFALFHPLKVPEMGLSLRYTVFVGGTDGFVVSRPPPTTSFLSFKNTGPPAGGPAFFYAFSICCFSYCSI